MEYGLGAATATAAQTTNGLNPCCNGIWSRRLGSWLLQKPN